MADFRLPYANAQAAGLLPGLAPIRANFERTALALRNELETSPRIVNTAMKKIPNATITSTKVKAVE